MRLHPLAMIAAIAVALVAGAAAAPWLRWLLGLASLCGAVALLASTRCRHRHASLLPAVHGAGPERDHARWYCDRCGHTWDATFVPETKPRLIYGGYDEQKAQRAAARADVLERERRRMAVKRAGWHVAAAQAAPNSPARQGPRPIEVMPMRRVRE